MELRHLRYFAAVAAHGSFSRAAHNLNLTQPALSRQVKDLEDELGVPLLVRGKNNVTLTESGEMFYEEARDLLARADQAILRVRGEARSEVLRVGYAPSLTTGIMPGALEKFQSATPRVRIELADLSTREMMEQAKAGQVDLVIAPGGFESAVPEFNWSELRRMALVLVMPVRHPLAKYKKIAPAQLRDLPLVGLGRTNFPEYAPRMRALLKPFGVTPQLSTWVNDGVSALFVAVEANNAATLLADGIACVMPRSLITRPFSPSLPPVVVMVGLPAVRPNPHADNFVQLLRTEVKRVNGNREAAPAGGSALNLRPAVAS